MPYRKKTKKNYRRKSRWARKRRTAVQPRSPIADSQIVKLRYCQIVTLDAGAGTAKNHTFRANDLYDPDSTGAGHQPMGFDQYMQFYNHFTVLGSKMKATFTPTAAGLNSAGICTVHTSPTTATVANIEDLMEQTGTIYTYMGPLQGKSAKLTKYFSTKKFFGRTDVRDNQDLAGNASGGPSEQAHFQVSFFNPSTSTDSQSIDVLVEIEYIALLHERKVLVAS